MTPTHGCLGSYRPKENSKPECSNPTNNPHTVENVGSLLCVGLCWIGLGKGPHLRKSQTQKINQQLNLGYFDSQAAAADGRTDEALRAH